MLMWTIPASPEFNKRYQMIGFTDPMPLEEHQYLGRELTKKGSSAVKTEIDENLIRFTEHTIMEGRTFYYQNGNWFVKVDIK